MSAIGVALDIDGVILRGGQLIPGAVEAVQLLLQKQIPLVFVTNGGGMREEMKAHELSKKLGVDILPQQVILCHTPFKSLVSQYESCPVLVVGRDECVDVAKHYGFNHVVTPKDLFNSCKNVLPTKKTAHCISENEDHGTHYHLRDSIEIALIFHDPVDWALDMQVLSDVVRPIGDVQKPIYASNADIVYATEYSLPRFTQGAFVESFKYLYGLHHQKPLQLTYYGKPYSIQYQFAEDVLIHEARCINVPKPLVFYGIGDNPKSDIRGANSAGEKWVSVLVRTGLFQAESENDPNDPADYVFHSVIDAVSYITSQ